MTTRPGRQTLYLYRRPGCELCDEARLLLQAALEERAMRSETVPLVRQVDIEGRPDLEDRYGASLPVMAVDGMELSLATSGRQIRAFLDRTLGRLA